MKHIATIAGVNHEAAEAIGAAAAVLAATDAAKPAKAARARNRTTRVPDAAIGGVHGGEVNPLEAHFPSAAVGFRVNVQAGKKPWSDGTISTTLADALVRVGNTSVFIPGCRIVKLDLPNGQGTRLQLQLPSSGQAFKHPMLQGEDHDGKATLEAWKTSVCDAFVAWRLADVKNGAPTISGKSAVIGIATDDKMLADLGLTR